MTYQSDHFLEAFYADLTTGLTKHDFMHRLKQVYAQKRAENEMDAYRLGAGIYKRLRDEIAPVARFLRHHALSSDIVRTVSPDPPDYIVIHVASNFERTIECTVAGAKPRRYVMERLNSTGQLSAFCGLPNSASEAEIRAAIAQQTMYTTEQAHKSMVKWIYDACYRKRLGSYAHTLLIEATTIYLPKQKWSEARADLASGVRDNFKEVYLVGYCGPGDICLRLK